ncbi:MAG TPA: fluoride efflux transporter CrcB [Gammaproteobacteria bacterium]|nr:fluoride efflux transporter CrcB [Gammaproteobacteria bacterium]
MWLFLSISAGAVAGAWARYGMTLLVQTVAGQRFPWATLSINVLGSFLMGFLFFETVERLAISPDLRAGLLTGGLGAFTTFSTFTMESLLLVEDGKILRALLYVGLSVVLGFSAALAGAYVSRRL